MRERLLFSAPLAAHLRGEPIRVVDAGARGELDPPFSLLPAELVGIIGFEPDADECERLNAGAGPNGTYFPVALWSEEARVPIHVAAVESCSSVHPPNEPVLSRFAPAHREPRRTVSTVDFPAMTLDAALASAGLDADFLKVDVQGSEFEVLTGAAETLSKQICAAIVETWTAEVHRGQRLTGDVLRLMADHGFELVDVSVAAGWTRDRPENLTGKAQVTGLDLLFLRDLRARPAAAATKLVKQAAIADVFGFPDIALDTLDAAETAGALGVAELREWVVRTSAPPSGGRARLFRRSRREDPYARLHY